MSATLYFSNSPAVLLERLSDNLEWDDPFLSPNIATPTAAMKRWVQLRLAERLGIVANVQFLHLERTLWKRLEELDQEHVVADRKPARLLDEQGLQLLILAMLRLAPPKEVAEYLEEGGAGRERDGIFSRRVIQLSHKLAGFFREYEYSRVHEHGREGLAHLWKHGRDCFRDYLDAGTPKARRAEVERLERWQKALYHALFRPGGLRDALGAATGQYAYTLPQYAEMVLGQERPPQAAGSEGKLPSYHLFGLSQISPFHRSLIRRLSDGEALPGRQARFFIYSLNPCAEYWEDALTPDERRMRQQVDLFRRQKYQDWRRLEPDEKARLRMETEAIQAEELHLPEENPLLALWGKPGRENIQLWLQITDYDFQGRFREARGRGLLGAVQNAVLGRRGALPPEERTVQDGTLQILACPEIHREVETVHQGIVDDLIADPSLRPDEIAVLVPDMGKYREVLAAVFGLTSDGEPGHVPYNLSDASASAESAYARAVADLFALARGRFSRKELFALASNPCFRSGLGLDEEALRAWGRWAGRLNIFHGFDGEDRKQRGYLVDPAHTWSHGLDRLVLGTVMESPAEDDLRHFDGVVPFADGDTADPDLLQPFVVAVEGLFRDLAPLRDGKARAWGAWLDILEALLDRYLVPPPDQALEAYVRAELRHYLLALRGMEEVERIQGGAAGAAGAGVPAELLLGLVEDRLRGIKAGREPHLAGGVNVAAISAMRSLPFKRVYVLGLGEGEFPEDEAASTLDLRGYRRVIGDVDPSARNRYLFLELLACAAGRLRLSWVSRDVRQGKDILMSSVLGELVDFLERCVLAPEGGKPARFRITQVPLLSRSPHLFGLAGEERAPWDPPPNRSREERLLAWLERKKAEFGAARAWPAFARANLPAPAGREVFPAAAAAATGPRPGPDARAPGASGTLGLDDFRLYLENPAQFTLRRWLGVSDRAEEDPREMEDEPFFCPFPRDVELLEGVFLDGMSRWSAPSREASRREYHARYHNHCLRGNMPAGHWRDLDRDALWERAEASLDALDAFLEPWRQSGRGLQVFRGAALGDAASRNGREPELRVPPAALEAGGRALEIHGHLPCLFRPVDGGGCFTLVFMTGEFDRRRLLPAFLFHQAGLLSDSPLGEWLRSGPFTVYYLSKSGKGFGEARNWAPFRTTPDEARSYLEGLAASMVSAPDFDMLPFALISDRLAPQGMLSDEGDYAAILREELDLSEDADEYSASYVPSESLRILNPEVPDDAERKIRARLGPFFNFRADP
jgi:exodeoxyribonuclease V gamma subunit